MKNANPSDSGIDGIVVTNHAGRQVDGAIASLDALEKIVDAVGDRLYVSENMLSDPPEKDVS